MADPAAIPLRPATSRPCPRLLLSRKRWGAWSFVSNIHFAQVADNQTTVGEIRLGVTGIMDAVVNAIAYLPADLRRGGRCLVQ